MEHESPQARGKGTLVSAIAFIVAGSYIGCLGIEALALAALGQTAVAVIEVSVAKRGGKLGTETYYVAHYRFNSPDGMKHSGHGGRYLKAPRQYAKTRVRYLPAAPGINRSQGDTSGWLVALYAAGMAIGWGLAFQLLRKQRTSWKPAWIAAAVLAGPLLYLLQNAAAFMPSPAPQRVEGTLGNSPGNLANGGYVATDGGDILFASFGHEAGFSQDGYLYRVSEGAASPARLATGSMEAINASGGTLFFIKWDLDAGACIHRLAAEGGRPKRILRDHASALCVKGEWLFYLPDLDDAGIFRARLNGRWRKQLTDDRASWLNVDDAGLYYVNHDERDRIYRISHNGAGRRCLGEDRATGLIVHDNWLYYRNESDADRPYRMTTSGENCEKLLEVAAYCLNADGPWLYFVEAGDIGRLCRVAIAGGTPECLAEMPQISRVHVARQRLVFASGEFGREKVFCVELDAGDGRPGPVRPWP